MLYESILGGGDKGNIGRNMVRNILNNSWGRLCLFATIISSLFLEVSDCFTNICAGVNGFNFNFITSIVNSVGLTMFTSVPNTTALV